MKNTASFTIFSIEGIPHKCETKNQAIVVGSSEATIPLTRVDYNCDQSTIEVQLKTTNQTPDNPQEILHRITHKKKT